MTEEKTKAIDTKASLEADWFAGIKNYLYAKDTSSPEGPVLNYLKEGSYIYKYLSYNRDMANAGRVGHFKINDISLSIPPESIAVQITNSTIDVPQIRSKHSVKLNTGYGEVAVNISITFTDHPAYSKTVSDEIKYKLIPLMTQLRTIPFCHVDNDYLRLRLLEAADKMAGSNILADNGIDLNNTSAEDAVATLRKNPKINMDSDIMLTYAAHTIATSDVSPRIVTLNLQFLLFNYSPFMPRVQYARNYLRNENGVVLAQHPSPVYAPELSFPFYEFYAKEFMNLEQRITQGINYVFDSTELTEETSSNITTSSIDAYKHEKSNDFIEFTYYTYNEIPLTWLSDEIRTSVREKQDRFSEPAGAVYQPLQFGGDFDKFAEALGKRESGGFDPKKFKDQYEVVNTLGYLGKYQFGKDRLTDLGYAIDGFVADNGQSGQYISKKDFLSNQQLQEELFVLHVKRRYNEILSNIKNGKLAYNDKWKAQGVTMSGMVAASHLKGMGGLYDIINKDIVGKDGYGTKITEYLFTFSGYDLSSLVNHSEEFFQTKEMKNLEEDFKKSTKEYKKEVKASNDALVNSFGFNTAMPKTSDYFNPLVSTSPLSAFENTTAQHIEKTLSDEDKQNAVYRDMTKQYLALLPKGSYTILEGEPGGSTAYIKIANRFAINLKNTEGFTLSGIECSGGHSVPKISIAGYRYATHQYMGGHVDKVMIGAVVSNSVGDIYLNKIQQIFDQASMNAIQYRYIAALDGVKIRHSYINTVQGGNAFVLDAMSTQTHPQIPNGSLVYISLTDFTQAREFAKKAFAFKFENRKRDISITKDGFEYLFKKYKVTFNTRKDKMVIGGGEKSEFLPLTSDKYLADLKDGDIILFNLFIADKKIAESNTQEVKIMQEILDAINFTFSTNGSFSRSFNDQYGLKQYLHKHPGNEANDKLLYRTLYTTGRSQSINNAIEKTINKHLYYFLKEVPSIASKYPPDVIAEYESINSPAYQDFDLPPTINPDYYFYNEMNAAKTEKNNKKITDLFEDSKMKYKYSKKIEDSVFNLVGKEKFWDDEQKRHVPYDDEFTKLVFDKPDPRRASATNRKDVKQPDHIDYKSSASNIVREPGSKASLQEDLLSYEKILFYFDGDETDESSDNFRKELAKYHLSNKNIADERSGMILCFPVFKIFILEEDDRDVLYPLRQDLNEMYGLNAIQEIHYVEHSDQPADLLTFRFVDLTSKFTSARFKEKPFTETKENSVRDTSKENPLDGIMMKDGTRIKFMIGYNNDVDKLTTKFNGQVVSIEPDNNEYTVVCQTFGTELVFERKNPDKPRDPSTYNAETKEIFQWVLSDEHPEVKHFGRWKLFDPNRAQFSDKEDFGIAAGSYVRIRPDGQSTRMWAWTISDSDMNILAPEESWYEGLGNIGGYIADNPLSSVASLFTNFDDVVYTLFDGFFKAYYIYNMTLWEVIDEMTYRYPGYIAKVLPYDDRCTLYYGPTESLYFYRSLSLAEKAELSNFKGGAKKKELDEAKAKFDEYEEKYKDILKQRKKLISKKGQDSTPGMFGIFANWDSIKKSQRKIDSKIKEIDDFLQQRNEFLIEFNNAARAYGELKKEFENARTQGSTKPIRMYHFLSSDKNIILNRIRADYRDVYTQVEVAYSGGGTSDRNDKEAWRTYYWQSGSVSLKMNDFLKDEDLRTTSIAYPNCQNRSGAYRYGAHELWRQSKKLYKGDLVILGNPDIKPFDVVILSDDHSQMYGPVEVMEHVISITPYEGMISTIRPGMLSSINNMITLDFADTIGQFMNYEKAGKTMDVGDYKLGIYGTIGAGAFTGFAATQAATGLALPMLGKFGIALSAGSFPVAIAGSLLAFSLATKVYQIAKHRNPIFLSPLVRNGAPYVYGISSYKIGGLMTWLEEEWVSFNKGLDAYMSVFESGLNDLFAD